MILPNPSSSNPDLQPDIYCLSYPAVRLLCLFLSEPWLWGEFMSFPKKLLEPVQIRGWGRSPSSVSPNIP